MSASADQVQDPVLAATDPVISPEVPVPVDDQILKDVSNLGSDETPESVAAGLVSLNNAGASNGAVGPTTSADEKENVPSHEQSASVDDGVFVDDKEAIIHGSDIVLEKTKDVQDAPVMEMDNAASDSIAVDNVDDMTLNEKANEIIAAKDIPSTSEAESVATVEHGIPADSGLIGPVASITEENTIDDSVNDSAIEIPLPVLEKNQDCAKVNGEDAAPADDVKLAETGNHNEAVQMDRRDATDNVDSNPEIMNEAPNGETLAIATVALQEKGNEVNVDVDIASSAAEGDALDVDAVPETKEENASIAMAEAPELDVTDSVVAQVDAADISVEPAVSMEDNLASDHVEPAAAASEAVAGTHDDVPKATAEDIVEQTQGKDVPTVAEEQVPVVEAAPPEADLKEDGAVVAIESEIAVESSDAGVTTEEVEQGAVDETSAELRNNLDTEPLVEEVEVGHEVDPTTEDVNNIEEASSHEELVHSAVEEEPKVAAVRVAEEIPDTGNDVVVAVDEITEAPEIITAPVDEVLTIPEAEPVDAGAEVEAETSLEEVSALVEGESVSASEQTTAPSDTVHKAASEPIEEDVAPASAVITEPVIESEEVVSPAEDVEAVTRETINEEASAKVEIEQVIADEAVIAAPVDEPSTTEAVVEGGNEEASVQVETEQIATPVDEPIAPVVESEGASACVEAEPLPSGEVPVIEREEVAETSDEVGAAAPETSVEKYEESPVTIEVQHVGAESIAETEEVTEEASETAGRVTQETLGSVEPDSIPTSDEVAAIVVEVAEEPVPAPIELPEENSATTMNVENEETPASVDALDETTIVEAESAPIEASAEVTVAASLGADADNDTVAEAQATHTEIPGEIALHTEPSTAVAKGEAVVVAPAPAVEAAGVEDAQETIEEVLAILETGSKSPLPIVEVENTGISQGGESVPQANEGASVDETPSAEPEEESKIESAPVAESFVTAAGQSDDVAVVESTIAPVVESVVVKENAPELRTSIISIETSLDTTPFTPVLDSGIGFKEQEPVLSTLSSIAEEFERSKSSWGPSSFQVSTVGGVEASGVGDVGSVPESTELAETGEPASVPLLVVEDTPVNEQVPTVGASEDFVSVDQPSLEQPPLSWTPSYSVHSQGSPTRVELVEDFSSTDKPVPTRELQEPATAAHGLPLEEQGGLTSIPVEEGFTAEVINHNESSEQIIEDATTTFGSHVPTDQVSESAPADLTEVSEEATGGLVVAVGEEDANENADQEANQEEEAKLTIDEAPARPWTPSYPTHSQGIPLVATKELENVPLASVTSDVALLAERSVKYHAENTVTVDSEHENIVDEQINTTEDEVHGQTSTEVFHASPVVALEEHKIEDEPLNPPQSSQAETEPPVAVFDKDETPSSVEQSQNNNIGEVVAAAIAPAIAIAALGARIQGLVPVADEETPQVDATLTVDTTAVPLLSVPSQVVDADATDIIVGAPERPRSPWTPSYSVTKQGAGLSQEEEAEVDHLEPLSPSAAHATTTSDSEPLLNEVQEDDPGSNALQTRPSQTVAGTEDIAKNEQFFLFGLRAIVAYLWVLPKWLSMTPPDHSRQGSSSSSSSSSSSKFFPGGWFIPKPNEGSASLDVAQGEFASSSKVTTSNDVFETLGSEVTDPSAAVNVAAGDDGRKRKWCVVM